MWLVIFVSVATYFVIDGYQQGRTDQFLSLDPNSGDCHEVPQTVTGNFYVDTTGKYNTQSGFQYPLHAYTISLLGLTYTTAHWKSVMQNITTQISGFGSKSMSRDFAWL
jgi:hypothetical protein